MNGAADKLSIRYILTDPDLEHMVLNGKSRLFGWTFKTQMYVAVVYLLVLMAILIHFLPTLLGSGQGAEDRLTVQSAIGLTGLVLVALYPKFNRWVIRRSSKAYQTLPLDLQLLIDDIGIESLLDGQSGHTAWMLVTRAVETESHILLYLNPLRGFVFPKSAFNSEVDLVKLREMIATHVVAAH